MLGCLLFIPWEIFSFFHSVGFFHQIPHNSKPYMCNLGKRFSRFLYLFHMKFSIFTYLNTFSSLCFNDFLNDILLLNLRVCLERVKRYKEQNLTGIYLVLLLIMDYFSDYTSLTYFMMKEKLSIYVQTSESKLS